MLPKDYDGQLCSIARTLEVVGERWSLLLIREVFMGRRRFSEMQKTLGVAKNVLSNRLDRLVDEDILERRPYSEHPPRYEYFLTDKGLDLWPTVVAMMHWGDKYFPEESGPPTVLVHKGECGGRVNDRRICERCGKELDVREARAEHSAPISEGLAELLNA